MNRFWLPALVCLVGCGVALRAEDAAPAPAHAHGHETGAAKSAAAATAPDAPKPEAFIRLDPANPKTVLVTVVSAYNSVNYGMNFNGFAKGKARYIVPIGWTVKVTFQNKSPVPHSVVVVEKAMVKKLQMGAPYFEGASSPEPVKGTTGPAVKFSFVASEAGEFALACGFPAHAANGHWIAFDVSADASGPTLRLGEAAAYAAQ
jgi:hypothetical protein